MPFGGGGWGELAATYPLSCPMGLMWLQMYRAILQTVLFLLTLLLQLANFLNLQSLLIRNRTRGRHLGGVTWHQLCQMDNGLRHEKQPSQVGALTMPDANYVMQRLERSSTALCVPSFAQMEDGKCLPMRRSLFGIKSELRD